MKTKSRHKILYPFLLGIILAMSLLTGCEKNDEDKTYTEMGMDSLENLDFASAAAYFDSAMNAREDMQLAYRGKGMAFLGLARYADAIDMFEKALAESDGNVHKIEYDISYYLAVAQVKNKDLDGAYDTYSAIIDMDEKNQDAYYLRGNVSLSRGDKIAALEDYDQSVIMDPTNYDNYIRICKDLSAAGYEDDGRSYIQRAVNTDYKKSEYQMGVFDYYLGDYNSARTAFESSRSGNTKKDSLDLIMYLGKTYRALGDTNYAAALYEEYLASHPEEAALYLQLGMVKMDLEDYSGALSAFDSGLACNVAAYDQSLRFNKIVAYEYLLDFKKASVLMQEYLNDYPDDEAALREYEFLKTR